MDRETYDRLWNDAVAMRQYLGELLKSCPELFPVGTEHGFQLTGHLPESTKMPGIRLRQLRLTQGGVLTLRPSFVLPYMTGTRRRTQRFPPPKKGTESTPRGFT
jgi:hypothetical protein